MKTILFSEHFVPGEFPVMVERMPYSGMSAGDAHSHEFSELTLITKGKCLHCCNGKSAGIGPEDVLLVHPGSVHWFEQAEKVEAISLLYDAEVPYAPLASSGFPLMREFYPERGAPKRNEAQPIGKFPECDFAMMMGMLLRLRYEVRHKRMGHKLLVPALFTEVVTYFARGYSTHIEVNAHWRLRKAIVYMNIHYREKISIARLCRIACPRESWFWAAVFLSQSIGCGLFGNRELEFFPFLLSHLDAAQWALVRCGGAAALPVGALLPLDLVRGWFGIPFSNFHRLFLRRRSLCLNRLFRLRRSGGIPFLM